MTTARTGNCITPAVPIGTNKEETLTMTEGFRSPPPPSPVAPGGWGDTPASRRQEVTDTAKQSTQQVAGTVKEQAGQVTEEAKHQAKQLLSQAQSELSDQAASTQQRVSEGLHALADELTGMARNSEQDGVATDLARQAADRARTAAGWLADRDPGSLLHEVRSFARRKPGTYLALALGAGVLAGRLTRGLATSTDDTPAGSAASTGLASTRTTFPTQFDGSEPLTDPFAGAPTTTLTGYETGADPASRAFPSPLDSLGTTGSLPGPRTAP